MAASNQQSQLRKITSDLDVSKFYAGYDFAASDDIVVRQPTIGEIIEYGESKYYSMIYMLTALPSDRISELWDAGVNFSEVSSFHFFHSLTSKMTTDMTRILFGDVIDLSRLKAGMLGEEEVLFDVERNVVITTNIYERIASFLCKVHGITKEPATPASRLALMAMVEIDRQEKQLLAAKSSNKVMLFPLLSSMTNSPGYKYTLEESLSVPIFRFMDSVNRVGLAKTVDQISVGYYTGSFDEKKFKPKESLNWMRDLYS